MSRATSKSRGLTAKQVRDLLAQTPPEHTPPEQTRPEHTPSEQTPPGQTRPEQTRPEPDPEVSQLTYSRAYRLADGSELLVEQSGRGRLHESRAALLAMLGEVSALKPVSPFGALLPQGRDFAAQAPTLAAQLQLRLPTPPSTPDVAAPGVSTPDVPAPNTTPPNTTPPNITAPNTTTPNTTALPDLDATVRRLGVAACRKPPLFGQLVAYVGETIIAVRGGGWQMRQDSDGTWEPWVVDAQGRAHAPFGLVFKELAEWGAGSSLTGVVAASLTPLRG